MRIRRPVDAGPPPPHPGDGSRSPAARIGVPHALTVAVGWSWRLLLVGIAGYVLAQVFAVLHLVVVALIAALLITALLRPLAMLLRRLLPGVLAAGVALLLAVALLGGVGYVIVLRAAPQVPALFDQLLATVEQLRAALATSSAGAGATDQLNGIATTITGWLQQNRGQAVAILTTGAGYLLDLATGLVLALFVTFFLLYDGERIWCWLLTPFTARARARTDRAGRAAWATLTGYVRGTAVIAVIHGVVIGVALLLLGAPLPLPLAILVFLGSFVPFVGALVAGGLAVLVTFSALGWVSALILLAVLVVENQLEAHVYQPAIVGRYVRLHPLAIGLSFAVGVTLAGIFGAIIAVPVAAVVHRAWPALFGHGGPEVRDAAPAAQRPA